MHAISFSRILPVILCVVLAVALAATAEARPSNKWRLHFNGKADEDGVITLKFTPEKGEPTTVAIEIDEGTRENQAAREARNQLTKEFRGEYDVDKDDGEEVKIRARMGEPDFEVEVVSNTVDGLKVKTDRK